MTYVSPSGKKVVASDDPNNIPVFDLTNDQEQLSTQLTEVSVIDEEIFHQLEQAETFRKFIEVEVLKIIKSLADTQQVAPERLQAIAQNTLELIQPGMDLKELYQNAVKLDDHYPELAPVVYKIMKVYEEKYEKKALDQVSQLIKTRKFEQAEELVKKVLKFKITN